jgi:hypothetical protein
LFAYAYLKPNKRMHVDRWPRIQSSEGLEKYVWELSVTPMGYFTGTIENPSCHVLWDYFACENEVLVFQSNKNDFPKVSFTLDGI